MTLRARACYIAPNSRGSEAGSRAPRGRGSGSNHGGRRVERPPARRDFVLFIGYWLPVLVYATLVLVVGGQANLQPPVRFVNADKLYHVLEYAVLGFLLARALRATLRVRIAVMAAVMAVGLGGLVGLTDELHQRFVPGRECSALDLVADLAGLMLAQLAFVFTRRN